ncbi:MAG TPA: PTS IIA-like nitrogen regulatory protein PtsN [Stellaceae bacterium]|nr:PTS IIA-like nitrogen regulatory protein PtsN [Stellaceae bacterium]
MEISDLITPERVIAKLRVANKRTVLQEMARRAASLIGEDEYKVFEILLEREQLGTTGIGGGTAVPHGRLPELAQPMGLFARLEKPVDFDAIDSQPVDLVFLLLTPSDAGANHLKALARISRLMRDRAMCAKLRGTESADAIYALLTDRATSHAA